MPGFRTLVSVSLSLQALVLLQGQQGTDPTSIMLAAREALGGDKRIAAVRTIVATGRTRQVRGDNLIPIEFEIAIELPDRYVRTDEIPAQESGPTRRGFNGAGLIQFPDAATPPPRGGPPPPARAGAPPPPGPGRAGGPSTSLGPGPPAMIDPVTALKQDFARLTLGMFATSFSSYPLTFASGGVAEAPEGKADVIDVKGSANFTARLFIDSQTHLPLMVSWASPPSAFAQSASADKPPSASPPSPLASASQAPENRIYYADYRDVDGLRFPFRIRRAIGATTTEETTFDRFRINAKIDPKKFEVRK